MTPSPSRRNPGPQRRGRPARAPRDAAPLPPGYPPRETIARWRVELLADADFLSVRRPDGPAARRRIRAWWANLDLATASDEEIAEVWRWREQDAADPAPLGWDVILAMFDGDRAAARAALAEECALRGL